MSNIHQRTFYLGSRVVVEGTSWGRRSWTQTMEADQYTLQSFKSVFFSRNVNQNMPKNALYFFEKKRC